MSPQTSHHPADVASWITLRWTRGTRYYRAHWEQDLWQGWSLTRVHGRIGPQLSPARASSSPLPGSGADGARRRHETPAPARLRIDELIHHTTTIGD
jgi:hypothetical protein